MNAVRRRGDDEPDAVVRPFWRESVPRVPVEDREEADQQCGEDHLWPDFADHHRPQEDRRHGDADLHPRQRDAKQAHHGPQRHDHWKCHWQEPHCRIAELRPPDPHGDHRQHVVQA
jgi:hypothetical protein